MARLIAALSGGVDSAVAAARAVDQGHDVTGVHLALSRTPQTHRTGSRGCCSLEDANDARRVADKLGIPFYVWDFSEQFHHEVVQQFLDEYRRGRTPNPCLRCNEKIKFAALCDRAVALGFDAVVTGHYASVTYDEAGRIELRRSVDAAKDQSYVLGVLTSEQLRRCVFPLGGMVKSEVRQEAARRGLRVADKPDSYDICFIPEGDTADYLHDKLGRRPGDIVDEDGTVLGRHDGVFTHTIGQRKGLHLGRPAPDGRPRYVLRLDAANNQVIVASHERLKITGLKGRDPIWCSGSPDVRIGQARPTAQADGQLPCADQPGEDPIAAQGRFAATVQLRAHGDALPAHVDYDANEVVITLDQPAYGIAPGQAAVIYDDAVVVGSVTIDQTW
ncbi:MAG: tRNA 2-thiouridine(34) synthase MnmA [Propionibacteriaceae bacterium]|jgi:tRNA-specific 2-thiouridylase|nr:tRNA 2-thiouridine(34) synthase MnmA [Propionibacteriaceae bacterium]